MKKIFFFSILSILINPIIKSQDDLKQSSILNFERARFKNGSTEAFFGQNTQFPQSVFSDNGNVNVIISFIITKKGTVDSVKIIKSPNQSVSIEALKAIDKSDGLWEPTKINGKLVDWKYIASFNFVTSSKILDLKNKTQKLIQKDKFENALETVNEGLKFNEYDKDLYQLRLSIYKKLNQIDLANGDLKKIDYIDKNLIIDIWLTVIGIPRKQSQY